ncbi:MAG: transketolase family protein [Thermomicrobiales bacterium]
MQTLTDIAARDPRILVLTGDLGFMALEPFSTRFPDRFFNVGVAEQNMVGMATGLAEAGFIPFVYSIATFASLRPYEFIRNGPILHHLPVRIVGIGGGLEYGSNGATHHALEDVGVMRLHPGMTIVVPVDYEQTRAALHATWDLAGPVYYRIGKDSKTVIPGLSGRFAVGAVQSVRDGADLLILALGTAAIEATDAARVLAEQGIDCAVGIVSCVNPPPSADLAHLLGRFPLALTVEAHSTVGGIGSLVAEVIAEQGLACRLVRCGITRMPDGITGSRDYLHHVHGLSCDALVAVAVRELGRGTQ